MGTRDLTGVRHHLLPCNGGTCIRNGAEELTRAVRDEIQKISADQIFKRLKEEGYKFTDKREMIVDLFVDNHHKYLTAKEVFEHVRDRFPNVSFDTIYRTLNLLRELNVIEKMEFNDEMSRYRLTCDEGHHHHLVCMNCGKISTLDKCPIEGIKGDIKDFEVTDHRFEMYGYCSSCRNPV